MVRDVAETTPKRTRLGMPEAFAGCHTAGVEGYLLEGHVPAAEVQRLLAARPAAIGLAVPGMPVGSEMSMVSVSHTLRCSSDFNPPPKYVSRCTEKTDK